MGEGGVREDKTPREPEPARESGFGWEISTCACSASAMLHPATQPSSRRRRCCF